MADVKRQMRVIEMSGYGGPDVLRVGSRPVPEISDHEVLIRVAAAGVNRPDVGQRLGHYPPPKGASDILGLEVAGTIEQAGASVTNWSVGSPVCALVPGGGYAEYCAAPASLCLPVPEGLTLNEAASLPETYFTVWSNVFDRGRLKHGETLLVHGGTSGIGITAIQLAKAFGARTIATVGSEQKRAACERLGADVSINYRAQDFVEAVADATNGQGADVVLDMVAGGYLQRNIACLAEEGRIVVISFLGGAEATISLMPLLRKRGIITGSTLRDRPVAFKSAIASSLRDRVWPLFASGAIKPCVHSTFELCRAAEAHELMESSQHVGKIVLTIEQ